MIRNPRAISRLSLILLLLIAAITGALLSYMGVMSHYYLVPEETSITITDVTFSTQNTTAFSVALLNPSYSPSDATVREIAVITSNNIVYFINITHPSLPHKIMAGKTETFTCLWDWSGYAREKIKVVVFIDEGSGATFQVETPQ